MSEPSRTRALQQALHELLSGGAAYSEFELIQHLQNPPFELLNPAALSDNLTLFQTHFLVYHCLYQLQEQYLRQGQGLLQISALDIHLKPGRHSFECDNDKTDNRDVNQNQRQLQAGYQPDQKLRDYYLNLSHLSNTTEDDVQALLDDFWRRMSRYEMTQADDKDIEAALEYFGLSNEKPVQWQQVKQQYRRRMHQTHPDKGGEKASAQQVQRYFELLRHRYEK